ncbi:MAG TPA: hypothetical protein VJY34_20005 [Roseiarcus sp.]|nr:hypothetical protein [Roseiarcus sp.]
MVDEESQDVASEPAESASERAGGAPVEAPPPTQQVGEVAPPAQQAGEAAPPAQQTQAAPSGRRGRGGAFLAGALGGLVVSAIAGGAGYYLYAPKADLEEANASRLAAIESQAQREDAAIAGIDKRVGALEGSSSAAALAAIDKRLSALQAANAAVDNHLGALQSANADEAPRIAAATQAVQTLTGEVKDLRADVDAARGEIPSLQARVAKLESGPPQAVAADISAVTARLDKIEAQLAAQEKPSASDNPAAVAIIAESLRDKLGRGAPFPTELAGLERLGVEPAKLAPLKAVVDGAPTDGALAADFEAVRSKVLAAAAPAKERSGPTEAGGAPTEDRGGIVGRFLAHLRNLVQVRNVNEAAGDGPQALASLIEADSRRGDVSGALAAFAKLPEPSRQAASAWASAAKARQSAEAALQSIRETAVAQLAESGKP